MIRLFGYYVAKIYLYLGIVEAGVFFFAFNLGVRARFDWKLPDDLDATAVLVTALLFAAVMSAAMVAMGLYQRGVQEQEAGFVVRLGIGFLLGTALLTVVFYTIPHVSVGRGVVGLSLIFSFVGISLLRWAFARFASAKNLRKFKKLFAADLVAEKSRERDEEK
jgi:FlaA1/EpsC-like NDP-sugar epimerase